MKKFTNRILKWISRYLCLDSGQFLWRLTIFLIANFLSWILMQFCIKSNRYGIEIESKGFCNFLIENRIETNSIWQPCSLLLSENASFHVFEVNCWSMRLLFKDSDWVPLKNSNHTFNWLKNSSVWPLHRWEPTWDLKSIWLQHRYMHALNSPLKCSASHTTDMNSRQAHCLTSRGPTLDFWFVGYKNSSELQNSNLKFLLNCTPKWRNKANRW